MSRGWRNRLVAAWYNGSAWPRLLLPLEALFRGSVYLRRLLYKAGMLSRYRAPVPVVVVGNLVVGGSGKTPAVVGLVSWLQSMDIRVGVISRGHGRTVRVPHRVGPDSTVDICGDEALLIYARTGCPLVVAASRAAAVQHLLHDVSLDLIVSDDGLQHYGLRRDLEIVLYDAGRGFGNGHCLPVGPLREPLSRLADADLVLATGIDTGDLGLAVVPEVLIRLCDGKQVPFSMAAQTLAGGENAAYGLAGIAHPEGFFELLRRAGFTIEEIVYPDHHRFCAGDISRLSNKPIIMTEKDAVKCARFAGDNAWYLRVNVCLPESLTSSVGALLPSGTPLRS